MRGARCAGGMNREWGAAGSRTSGSGAGVMQQVMRCFRGGGILPRRGGDGAAGGRTANSSLFSRHSSLRAGRRAPRLARRARPTRSGWGVEGNGRGWKPHLRKWGGSGATSHAGLPGVRHLAAPGWGWSGRRPHRNLSLVTAAAGRRYQTAGLENEPLASVRRSGKWDAARAEGRMCL